MSLDFILFLLFSLYVFFFFLSSSAKFIQTERMIDVFIAIAGVLSVFSLCILFAPGYSQKLPGMNLLFSTYGHNHLATYLVILFPVVCARFFLNIKKGTFVKSREMYLEIFILSLFTITILFSGSRVLSLVLILELIFSFLTQLKDWMVSDKLVKIFLFFFVFSGLIVTFQIFFSLVNPDVCQSILHFLNFTKVCKPLLLDYRIDYWTQATHAIIDFPIWGYGPGTFSLISKKYRATPFVSSSYAHNSYLQLSSELGIVAGLLFVLFMLSLLIETFFLIKQKGKSQDEQMMLLGLVMIYFINIYDFDWNFISLFVFTFIFLALILRQKQQQGFERLGQYCQMSFKVTILYFSLLFLITEFLLQSQKENLAFSIFPFFNSQQTLFLASSKNDPKIKKFLLENRIDIYPYRIEDENTLINLFDDDPWFIAKNISPNQSGFALTNDKVTIISKAIHLINSGQQLKGGELEYIEKQNIANFLFRSAEKSFDRKLFSEAGELLLLSYQINEWSLAENQIFLLSFQNETEKRDFFQGIEKIPRDAWGANTEQIENLM